MPSEFSEGAIIRQLSALLGEPVDAAPEFALAMNLTAGYGRAFASYVLLAATDFKRATPSNPIAIRELEEFIISKLLMSHPHDFTEALRRTEKSIAPRDMKRAIDFMEAMLGAPIGIAEIAEAAGIAGRTLFKHFHDFYGISPMRYLRRARFERVQEALKRAQPEDSITEIAMAWGFTHMGRFSGRISQSLRRTAVGHPQAHPLTFTKSFAIDPSGPGAGRPVDGVWFGWMLDAGLKIGCRKPEFLRVRPPIGAAEGTVVVE